MDSRRWPGSQQGIFVGAIQLHLERWAQQTCALQARGGLLLARWHPCPQLRSVKPSTATSGMTPFGTHQTWVSTGEIRTARAPRVKQCAQMLSKPTAPSSYWISSKVCKRGFSPSAPAAAPSPPPEAGAFFKTQKPFPRVATSRFHSVHLVYSHEWSI